MQKRPRKSEAASVGYLASEYAVTQEECARRLGMTIKQVKRIEYRALRKLAAAARESFIARELMQR